MLIVIVILILILTLILKFIENIRLNTPSNRSITVNNLEEVLSLFICPILQIISIAYSLRYFTTKLKLEEDESIREVIPKAKRDVFIFVIIFLLYDIIVFTLCEGKYSFDYYYYYYYY